MATLCGLQSIMHLMYQKIGLEYYLNTPYNSKPDLALKKSGLTLPPVKHLKLSLINTSMITVVVG